MKVLLLSPLPPPMGGIARWSNIVINELNKKKDWSVKHINISPEFSGKITLSKRIIYGLIGMFKIIKNFSGEIGNSVDVVHMTSSGSFALIRDIYIAKSAKKQGVPFVYHLHFGRLNDVFKSNGLECKLIKKVFKYCSKIIAIDNITLDALVENGYEYKSVYCPNPICVKDLQKIIQPFSLRENKVVYLGHILKEKGIEELLDTWVEVSKQFPEMKLEIIGEPYDEDYLTKLKYDESVIFTGAKDHETAMKMLAGAKLFVLPSYSEGFPNVILEAMALKVPIIATNVGAIPEMLSDECGIIIEPKLVGQLKVSICSFLASNELQMKLAERAFQRVNKHYDVSNTVTAYIKIWEQYEG